MKVPQMIAAELRRLTSSRMSLIALVALLLVPILYGGLYLWANQDPYGSLSRVPVALVVDDTGAAVNGQQRNFGDEVADELLGGDTFEWHQVSADAATAGLENGDFDFIVEVPADFSASIASISTDVPRQADIVLKTNDANNYLASTIGTQAVARIQSTVAQKVVDQGGLTLLNALSTIRVKLTDAASGAQQLVDGLGTARDGSTRLADGAGALASGTAQLRDGATTLRDGAAQVSSGAQQVAAGTQQVATVADRVAAASADAASLLPTARADIAQRLADAGVDPARVAEVLAALDPVGQRLSDADTRVQTAVGQIDQLSAGAQQLSAGAQQVASGSAALADGAASAADGAAQLSDGANSLDGGIAQIADGAAQLQTGLADGVNQIPDTDDATRASQASTLSDPVAVSTSALTQAQNYGAGLAPFFAALAGWIGIYALFLIVKPVSRRAVTALHSPVRVTLAGWLTPALLGGVQMLGLFGVLALALGFSFANPLATLGILLLATATYAAIVLALNVWLGSVGQFLGLVLMVLQLVTAGGTFPWQTLPAPLAALHHVLPMGYVVDAMRQVMYGGDLDRVWLDLAVLGTWLVGAGIVAAIGVGRMTRFRTLRDLQPSVIG
ncbi:putative membrane protein [Microbacterium sp. AG1240]|uniref:YhgE/Pip domain-containing protein n=1 Tax=Microbacterium sp. AG1240 TaxID=2183992 RepID=UPI000EB36521|nr:YhgE/Pip domain-containing protein [Microbacterium sp. AG1240]RKT31673.1 putative membrane protein [Microbacterium sp. AG1240]